MKAFPVSSALDRADGQQEETVLTGSVNWGSRAQIGPTLDHALDTVKHNCAVYYNASWRQEPA